MEEISISEFKAKCTAVVDRVSKTRQPVRITRHGKPVAEVVPPTVSVDRSKWIGSMKGKIEILGDIISPVVDEDDWEALKD